MATIEPHEVKHYLSQVRFINNNIDSRQRELDSIRQSFLKVSTIEDDKVQESGSQYDDKYMLLFEISEEINEEVDTLIKKQRKIRNQINRLDDQLCAIVLREKYLNGRTWEEIADSLGQSVRNIHNVHGKALILFAERNEEKALEC